MAWEVDSTDDFDEWFSGTTDEEQDRIVAAMRLLRQDGPTLGRPFVDRIEMSRHPNMKELRVRHIRILFAFDPKRQAILLLGGSKEGKWDTWYDEYVPKADDLFDQHLTHIREEQEKEARHAEKVQRSRRRHRGKP